MRKSTNILIGFLFIIGIMLLLIIVVGETGGETIVVAQDGSGDYENIQDAIDATGAGGEASKVGRARGGERTVTGGGREAGKVGRSRGGERTVIGGGEGSR